MENIGEKMESLIFLSGEEVKIEELAKFYNLTFYEVEEILRDLKEKRKKSGINVKMEKGFVSLVSNPLYGEDIKNFFNPEVKIKKLTKTTMETLAIIAYKGPITKGEIEEIKGVNVDKTMSNLLEKNLIYISGRKKSIGTPNLYQVTEEFYSYLDIEGKNQLPGYEQYEKIKLLYGEEDKKIARKDEIELKNETE